MLVSYSCAFLSYKRLASDFSAVKYIEAFWCALADTLMRRFLFGSALSYRYTASLAERSKYWLHETELSWCVLTCRSRGKARCEVFTLTWDICIYLQKIRSSHSQWRLISCKMTSRQWRITCLDMNKIWQAAHQNVGRAILQLGLLSYSAWPSVVSFSTYRTILISDAHAILQLFHQCKIDTPILLPEQSILQYQHYPTTSLSYYLTLFTNALYCRLKFNISTLNQNIGCIIM